MAAAYNPCDANYLSQFVSGNIIVCSTTFQDYETFTGQAEIDQVAVNAASQAIQAAQNGDFSKLSTVNVAATAALQQEAHVPSDVANTTDAVASSTVGQIFTTCGNGDAGLAIPGLPCIAFKWLALGIGGLVVLCFLALVSSIVPRPR